MRPAAFTEKQEPGVRLGGPDAACGMWRSLAAGGVAGVTCCFVGLVVGRAGWASLRRPAGAAAGRS